MPIASFDISDLFGDDRTLPTPEEYQYYHQLKDNNTLFINGEINGDILENVILPLQDMDKDPNVKHITLKINSPGGSVYDGCALIDAIEATTTPITIEVVGMAASMASYIVMCKGDNIHKIAHRFSVSLIHSGSTQITGETDSVMDAADFTKRYDKKIEQYIYDHTNITKSIYARMKRKEVWLDADQMLKYGIVDEIV